MKFAKGWLAFLVAIFLFGAGFYFLSRPSVSFVEVSGDSMSGIAEGGELLEVDYDYYANHEVGRGDVVLYQYAGHENPLLKQVRGIPGDRFSIQPEGGYSLILINGQPALTAEGEEFQIEGNEQLLLGQYVEDYNGIIPGGAYLLLGNMRFGSLDSSRFGLVSKDDILGKVVE
ncbi:MAG: signal peptidase I [Candidatus Paceibacterota bacterium]